MFYKLKKSLIKRSIDKKKAGMSFDIEYADNYALPVDAPAEQNDSHYFLLFSPSSTQSLYFRLGKRGADYADEIWLVYKDSENRVYIAANDHIKKGESLPARVECVQAGKVMRFYYEGEVVEAKPSQRGYVKDESKKPVKMTLSGEFIATSVAFEFMHHLSSEALARALAREKLSRLSEFRSIQQTTTSRQEGAVCKFS